MTGRTARGGGNLDAKRRVLGFRIGDRAYAVPLDAFKNSWVLRVDADGTAITLVASLDRSTARAFLSGLRTFEAKAVKGRVVLKDVETASEWDGYVGTAGAGPLAGQTLEQVPIFQAYWFAWRAFYPRTVVLGR